MGKKARKSTGNSPAGRMPAEELPAGVLRDDDGLHIAVWSADLWPFLSAVAAVPFLTFGREPVGVAVPVLAVSVVGYALAGISRTVAKRSRQRPAPAETLRTAARWQTWGAVGLLVAGLLLFGIGAWRLRTVPMSELSWSVGAFAAVLPACYWAFHAHRTAARMYGLARLADGSWRFVVSAYPRLGGGGPAGYVAPHGAGWPTAVASAAWTVIAAVALLGMVAQASVLLRGLTADTLSELVTLVAGVVGAATGVVWLTTVRAMLGDGLPPARLRRLGRVTYGLAIGHFVVAAGLMVAGAAIGASGSTLWSTLIPALIPTGVLVGVGLYAHAVATGVEAGAQP